jgi:hypothetical protein
MNTSKNTALSALAAAAITPFLEKHYGLKVSADDMMELMGAAALSWHVIENGFGPYAKRIFDHYFPPVVYHDLPVINAAEVVHTEHPFQPVEPAQSVNLTEQSK